MAINNELIKFLGIQYQEKLRQVENSLKLYFQSVVILGIGVVAAITALSVEKDVSNIIFVGIPLFLISWFGCFLWIYYEHHMIRISLDYSEKILAENFNIPPEKTFLYHEDFLGVLNQAIFMPKLLSFLKKHQFKSVQVVFVIIGLPGFGLFSYCGYRAFNLLRDKEQFGLIIAILYAIFLLLSATILLAIHIQCVKRERKLKKHLGIISKWIDNKDWVLK